MYRIWVQAFRNGKHVWSMMSAKEYVRKGNAERYAKMMYRDHDTLTYKCIVSEENPWRERN